uniref:Uncharacterized protein n=1 Tax=Lepeophtheirus salmonis TaxID=72036 RepID=A0A0K2T8Q0_LEPSM
MNLFLYKINMDLRTYLKILKNVFLFHV